MRDKIYAWLLSIHILIFICLAAFTNIIGSWLLSSLIDFENPFPIQGYYNVPFHILTAIILSPILETFALQYLIIKLVQRLRWGNIPAIFISAMLFGVAHFFSFKYIIFAFWSGLLYGSCFVLLQQRKEKAWLWVSLIHAMYNTYVISAMLMPYILDPHRKPLNWDWWF